MSNQKGSVKLVAIVFLLLILIGILIAASGFVYHKLRSDDAIKTVATLGSDVKLTFSQLRPNFPWDGMDFMNPELTTPSGNVSFDTLIIKSDTPTSGYLLSEVDINAVNGSLPVSIITKHMPRTLSEVVRLSGFPTGSVLPFNLIAKGTLLDDRSGTGKIDVDFDIKPIGHIKGNITLQGYFTDVKQNSANTGMKSLRLTYSDRKLINGFANYVMSRNRQFKSPSAAKKRSS